MRYLLAILLLTFALTSCNPERLIGVDDDRKEDSRDRDDRKKDEDKRDDKNKDRDREIGIRELPENVRAFIDINFPEAEIRKAFVRGDFIVVYLSNGTVLYFDRATGRLAKRVDNIEDDRDKDRDEDKDDDREGDRDRDEEDDDDDDEDDRDSDRNSDR